MFNRKSSYALNKKDPNAIVYMDANEAIIRLTREDFAREEEFLKWKSLSDADYEHYLMGEIDLNTYKAEKAACNELLLKTKNAYRHTSFLRCCGLSMWSIWPHGFSLLQQVDKRPLSYGKSMWTICLH